MSTGNGDISPGRRVTKSRSFLRFAYKKKNQKKKEKIVHAVLHSVVTNRKRAAAFNRGYRSVNCEFKNRISGFFKNPSSTFRRNFFPSGSDNTGPRASALYNIIILANSSWENRSIDIVTPPTVYYYIIIIYYSLLFRLYVYLLIRFYFDYK